MEGRLMSIIALYLWTIMKNKKIYIILDIVQKKEEKIMVRR